MTNIRQSFAWWSFSRSDIAPASLLRAAAEIGYSGVELLPRELWPPAREHGLAISAMVGHESIRDGLNRRENHPRIEAEVRANLELAQTWNIPVLICFSGSRQGEDDDAGVEITAEALRRLAPLAEAAGVTLALELLNSKRDHADYQADHTAWGVRVCKSVASPAVGLLYDIYHMQLMEGDIIHTVQDHHACIAHYHTAGVPGRHELDATQELFYPAIFRTIQATGYVGYICHELLPIGDPVAALKQAYDLCAEAWRPV